MLKVNELDAGNNDFEFNTCLKWFQILMFYIVLNYKERPDVWLR